VSVRERRLRNLGRDYPKLGSYRGDSSHYKGRVLSIGLGRTIGLIFVLVSLAAIIMAATMISPMFLILMTLIAIPFIFGYD